MHRNWIRQQFSTEIRIAMQSLLELHKVLAISAFSGQGAHERGGEGERFFTTDMASTAAPERERDRE
jgi:hypothetical protein